MNGRVYDPLVARFLSGDPIIQDPLNGQNYSRYTYVFNNPTNFTDPTGFSCADGSDKKACQGMSTNTQMTGLVDTPLQKRLDNQVAVELRVPEKKGPAATNQVDAKLGRGDAQGKGSANTSGDSGSAPKLLVDRVYLTGMSQELPDTIVYKHEGVREPSKDKAAADFLLADPVEQTFRLFASDGKAAAAGMIAGMVNPRQWIAKGAKALAGNGGKRLVYRSASGTPASMTPRAKDVGGLSAADSLSNALPGKNQVIDTSKLENLCAVCDNPATGHVSIYPKDPSQMQGWINSRGGDTVHPLTQELMDAVIGTVQK
jgi:hypothetical protein